MPSGILAVSGWELASIVAKWVLYACTFAGAGGALFMAIFSARIPPLQRRAVVHWVWLTCSAALVMGVARAGVLAGALGGDGVAMLGSMLRGNEAMSLLLRSAGLVATLASLACARRSRMVLSIAGVCLVAVSYTRVGHVLEATSPLTAQAMLALHVFSLCYWLGALVPLRLCCQEGRAAGQLLSDFGHLAVYLVGALLFAGGSLLFLLLDGAAETLSARYVGLFVAKIALVVLMIAMAALNKLDLVPRLNRGEIAALVKLRRSIGVEIAAALLILLAMAALTTVASLSPE